MKYLDQFRNPDIIKKFLEIISYELKTYNKKIKLMEVCGTHTMAIGKAGLRKILPQNIFLISGPGCPVCVSPNEYIDKAIEYSKMKNTIISTFGDMMKVPGSYSSLEKEKGNGADIRVVYSPMDALKIAEENKRKNVIFLGIGFETTAPTVALTIKTSFEKNIKNFFVYSGHKLIPPAMEVLVQDKKIEIDGFICPGHVSTIIGGMPYKFIPQKYGISCVITGFEPVDILQAIYTLVKKITKKQKPSVEIQYKRSVKKQGNEKAKQIIEDVFEITDSKWRGLGNIKKSGLKIKDKYKEIDAEENFEVKVKEVKENPNCICGDILKGVKNPKQCPLFLKKCNPENPVGPCMVSSEGTCASYFKYEI